MINYIIIAFVAMVGASSCEQSKKNEAARERALQAVEMVLAVDTVQPVDSFALEHAILMAKAGESEYQIAGDEETAEAFREAFEETLSEDGYANMYEIMKALVECGFDGFCSIDHGFAGYPSMGGQLGSMAYPTGHMKGLLHAAQQELGRCR